MKSEPRGSNWSDRREDARFATNCDLIAGEISEARMHREKFNRRRAVMPKGN